HSDEVVNVLNALGVVAQGKGDLEQAEKHLTEALEIRKKAQGPGSLYSSGLAHNLAGIRLRRGNNAGAIDLLTHWAEVTREEYGSASKEHLRLLTALGEAYWALGDYATAEAQLVQVLEKGESVWHEASAERLRALETLVGVHAAAGRPAEALRLCRE